MVAGVVEDVMGVAVVLQVFGNIYGCHTTTTDFLLDGVAVGKCSLESFQQVSHGEPSCGPALSYGLRREGASLAPNTTFAGHLMH